MYDMMGQGRANRWPAVLLVAISALLGVMAVTGRAGWNPLAGTTTEPPQANLWFGGYVDVTLQPRYPFEHSQADGPATTVLAFVVADPKRPCQPSWGSQYSLEQAKTSLDLDGAVRRARQNGDDVAVSFGGQLEKELAVACTDQEQLFRAYQSVVARYGLDTVDMDIEGDALTDAAGSRRAEALARVQAARKEAGKPLQVWLTLPVSTSGLADEGKAAVRHMLQAGVELAGVNIMTMNLDTRLSGKSMLDSAVQAAESTKSQLAELYRGANQNLDDAGLWQRIGLTPMVGENDTAGDVFDLQTAKGLNQFARDRGIGRISLWSLNRDTACRAAPSGTKATRVSDSCSGIPQEPGAFARMLGAGFTQKAQMVLRDPASPGSTGTPGTPDPRSSATLGP